MLMLRLARPGLVGALALVWAGVASATPVIFTFASSATLGGAFPSTQVFTPALPFSGAGDVDEAAGTYTTLSLPAFTVVIDVLATTGDDASVLTTGWSQTGGFAGGAGGAMASTSATGTSACTPLSTLGGLICSGISVTVAPWPPTGAAGPFGAAGATIDLTDGIGFDGTITVNTANDPNGGQVQSIYTYSLDSDGDGASDSVDNCKYEPNPTQSDVGGLGAAPPDGIGDACQCGDTNNSGTVTATDATVLKRALLGLSPYFSVAAMGPGLAKCNVAATVTPGVAGCTSTDATVISRALLSLSPGINQGCDAAQP
jgi:hypothetical protein